ncbi:bifunctional DNA primase/polymerase [Caldicellulosiruptor bescii]|uniref:bifunctional DNA primase/polymerase n=1 Tax=Caldicellulosiruptor bescii TaxID=31899 RepID=UPI0009B0791D|nr:bifunctional DNA primase/polymerase [Caldicellulosiruptor bescii]SLL40202.1 putative DNA primase/helicase [Caldicellulosiruptor bescii]
MRKDIRKYLEFYKGIGLRLTALNGKKPFLADWYYKELSDEELLEYWAQGYNIGGKMGEKSCWMVDIDIDHPAANKIVDLYLPIDTLKFGRATKPLSHLLYFSENCKSLKRDFKFSNQTEKTTIVEIRSTGQQTMIPPSIHPDTKEELRFVGELKEPLKIEADLLTAAVNKIAAATLIGLHWYEGQRQDCALALAGGLLRAGWSEEEAEKFIQAVCLVADDEESKKRIKTVIQTAKKQEENKATTGWRRLAQLIGNEVVAKVIEWLGIKQTKAELLSMAELLSLELPPVEFLLEGLLPNEGLTILAGRER